MFKKKEPVKPEVYVKTDYILLKYNKNREVFTKGGHFYVRNWKASHATYTYLRIVDVLQSMKETHEEYRKEFDSLQQYIRDIRQETDNARLMVDKAEDSAKEEIRAYKAQAGLVGATFMDWEDFT